MIRPQKYQARVSFVNQLNKTVYWLGFNHITPSEIDFIPGQRCLFNVGPKHNNYSITSSPSKKNEIQICVDTSPNGPGSQWIRTREIGDLVDFLGPLGNFTLKDTEGGSKVFIATGTGVSPIHSMIFTLLEKNYKDPIYLYFGERYEQDIFWKNQFESLSKKYPNFHYIIVLSQPGQTWQGKKGYVQDHIENNLWNKNTSEFYLCGNGKMIDGAMQTLTKNGISKEQIFTERFYEVSISEKL